MTTAKSRTPGNPGASEWLTVEEVCAELKISPGPFTAGGRRAPARAVSALPGAASASGGTGWTRGLTRPSRTSREQLRRPVLADRDAEGQGGQSPRPVGRRRAAVQRLVRHEGTGRIAPRQAQGGGQARRRVRHRDRTARVDGPHAAGRVLLRALRRVRRGDLAGVVREDKARFSAGWERDASVRLRAGDFSVVPAYDRRGRIRGDHREAAYNRAEGAWLADHLQGQDAILLAGSNEEAAELARRVQARLVAMGTVVQPRAPLAEGNQAGTGDLIRARLNTSIDADGQRLTNRDVLRIEGWQGQAGEVARRLPGGGWSGRSWCRCPTSPVPPNCIMRAIST